VNLLELIVHSGFRTVTALARACDASRTTIKQYVIGNVVTTPAVYTVIRVSRALRCTEDGVLAAIAESRRQWIQREGGATGARRQAPRRRFAPSAGAIIAGMITACDPASGCGQRNVRLHRKRRLRGGTGLQHA
jgi:hypothetical protein